MNGRLTKAEIARIPALLKLTYSMMTEGDCDALERAADAGLLERFWSSGTFGKLFTRYRITDAGRAALSEEKKP